MLSRNAAHAPAHHSLGLRNHACVKSVCTRFQLIGAKISSNYVRSRLESKSFHSELVRPGTVRASVRHSVLGMHDQRVAWPNRIPYFKNACFGIETVDAEHYERLVAGYTAPSPPPIAGSAINQNSDSTAVGNIRVNGTGGSIPGKLWSVKYIFAQHMHACVGCHDLNMKYLCTNICAKTQSFHRVSMQRTSTKPFSRRP